MNLTHYCNAIGDLPLKLDSGLRPETGPQKPLKAAAGK
jgi:hypothetical protein